MLDIHGHLIEVGDIVKTQQYPGGYFPPAEPDTGIVEETINAFGENTLEIVFRRPGKDYDQRRLLDNQINEIIFKSML